MTDKEIKRLNKYLEVSEITAEAWRVKDFNSSLWKYDDEPSAYNAWTAWIEEARKTGLKPMEKMASMVENHLSGIVNAVVLGATNAIAESVNSKIKNIKRLSYQIAVLDTEIPQADHTRSSTQLQLSHYNEWE